jgi:transcription initiation factor TFIIB
VSSCTEVVVDHEKGVVICAETGEVIEENNIVLGPDWRAFNAEEWQRRAHSEVISQAVHDTGLTTDIGVNDISSTLVSHREYMKMIKLRQLNKKMRVSKQDRKLVEALSKLNHVCAVLGVPEQVKETAAVILKRIFYVLQPRKDDLLPIALISVIFSARKHGIPMRIKQLLNEFGVPEDKYWKLLSEIHVKVDVSEFKSYNDPRAFLPTIISNLKASQKVYMLSSKIIEVLKKNGLTEGKDPAGIAAAVVYIAATVLDEKKTQKEVARAANVTEVTVRNRYRDIVDKILVTVYI